MKNCVDEQMCKERPGLDHVGVGVGGVITARDTVLLLRRRKPPESDCWTIPGGAIEFGETVETALVRELREEIGVNTNIIAPLGVTDHILPSEGVHWVSLRFLVKIIEGVPRNASPESHSDIKWFPIRDLPPNITLTTREAIAAYLKWLETAN